MSTHDDLRTQLENARADTRPEWHEGYADGFEGGWHAATTWAATQAKLYEMARDHDAILFDTETYEMAAGRHGDEWAAFNYGRDHLRREVTP